MHPETKKQLPVLIALSAILLVAIGYSVMKSMSKGQVAAPVQSEQAQAGSADKNPIATPEGKTTASDSSTTEEGSATYNFIGNPPRDPFEPRLLGVSGGPTVKPGFIRAQAPQHTPKPKGRNFPSLGLKPFDPSKIGIQPGGQPAENGLGSTASDIPDKPAYLATGVVQGREDIAIIRGDGGARYFVRRGQSVGDGYVVQMISSNEVVLKSKDRKIFLKVGGAQDAKSSNSAR